MEKYRLIEKELSNKYKDTIFKIIENDNDIEILYSNKEYINDDNFLEDIIDISRKYLEENDLWKLVTTYDLFNEINIGKEME